ncbi:MAG: hypothetical protein GF408_00760 [Candidatus Omnitrophica bacterium]|nr:hypothetical protein [Candidatus Omnitrophota bacterium]
MRKYPLSWKNDPAPVSDYYGEPVIEKRMAEYLGGDTLDEATAVYLTRCDPKNRLKNIRKPAELASFLRDGIDIGRSLWDKEDLIVHLDIEYVNFDFPGEPYLDPKRSYGIQEPLIKTLRNDLEGFGIEPLHLVTGRGHHFTWKIGGKTAVFRELEKIGRLPEELRKMYEKGHGPEGEHVTPGLAKAYAGLALVMEYLAGRAILSARRETPVPVKTICAPERVCERGWEAVILDLSEYGDPLHTRMIRLPFSLYLKPWEEDTLAKDDIGGKKGLSCVIPGGGMKPEDFAKASGDPSRIIDLALRSEMFIPEAAGGTGAVIKEYKTSGTKHYHDWFFSREQYLPEEWPRTYDLFSHKGMPACARNILEEPNDLLLKPPCQEMLIKVLMSLGWHPRHIAGLFRSKYERNHGWGDMWYRYNAVSRAEFYCRTVAEGIFNGTDDLSGFDCSVPLRFCRCRKEECSGLANYRDSLIKRREHGKLGSSPFNRLFL